MQKVLELKRQIWSRRRSGIGHQPVLRQQNKDNNPSWQVASPYYKTVQ